MGSKARMRKTYCSMDAFWGVSARKHLCLHPWSASVIFHAHPTHPHSIIAKRYQERMREESESFVWTDKKGGFRIRWCHAYHSACPVRDAIVHCFISFLWTGENDSYTLCMTRKKNLRFQKYLHTCGGGLIVMYLRMFCALGEIGGNMGLFLGSSILTIFEFVDFVIYLCSRRNKKDSWLHKREDSPDYPWML